MDVHNQDSTVSPDRVVEMIALTPTERLEWVANRHGSSDVASHAERCLSLYEDFLRVTDARKSEQIALFLDRERRRKLGAAEYKFGDEMFELLKSVGGDLFRLLVV